MLTVARSSGERARFHIEANEGLLWSGIKSLPKPPAGITAAPMLATRQGVATASNRETVHGHKGGLGAHTVVLTEAPRTTHAPQGQMFACPGSGERRR